MPTLAEIRQQYPQYQDMSDQDLASALHSKFYSDMPRAEFDKKIGYSEQPAKPDAGALHAASGSFLEGIPVVGPALVAGAERVGAGVDSLLDGVPYNDALKARQERFQASKEQHPVASTAGNVAGGVAGTLPLVVAAPAAFGGGTGGLMARSAASALSSGALGGADAAVRSGGDPNETAIGAGLGAGFGFVAPGIATGIGSVASRAVTPFRTSPERVAAANVLRQEGVDLTAGQQTGSRGLRYAEAEIGGRRAEDITERQGRQFTAAALRRAGINADHATPDVIDNAFTRIGGEFDRLGANNSAQVDQQFAHDLRGAVDEYHSLVAQPNRAPAVDNFLAEIATTAQRNGGVLPGDVYQSLRSRMERAARNLGNNPEARTAIRGMREALDDAMERSIAASGNTHDIAAWQQARRQYRNLLVLERAATGAGENAALGSISPSQLRNATVGQGRRAYARGQGDFADLARAGEALLKPLPQSGTAPRLRAQNLGAAIVPTLAGAGVGGTYGMNEGGLPGAIVGAGAGAAIPRVAGALMMSRPGQAFLANQIANAGSPRLEAITRLLLAASPPIANQGRAGQ